MLNRCTSCKKGEVDYSLSEVYLIPDTNPQQTGIEGICMTCSTHFFVKFKEFKTEVTEFNDLMEEISKTTLD